jgi:gamma-glutamyltranspeptidase/glutathione hydrolase
MPSRRDFHKLTLAAGTAALAGSTRAQNAAQAASASGASKRSADTLRPELYGTHGVVAAGRHYTVEAGTRILAAGGNAFDAGCSSGIRCGRE